MCGIAGFSGNFNSTLLEAMSSAIAHRGPDDSGTCYFKDRGIGLAHRRLSIIDLTSQGHQPMWDCTNRAVIVFNGEIYNYRELRKDLLKKDVVFKSQSDTEVLLSLYLLYGTKALGMLNGIFAFAIWDTRTKTLFLARDGVGVKPLYYSELPKGFLFASELKAIVKYDGLDMTLSKEAIHYYMTYLWAPAPHTMLASVKKLEPGNALIVEDGKICKHWQFYDLPFGQEIDNISEKDAISRVYDGIRSAVQRQMVSDVPVGAFLSGGLDSSSVVAFARQFAPKQKIKCFTIGFNDTLFSREGMAEDLPYAQRVAKHLDVDLLTVRVGPEMIEHLGKLIYYLDEPQADPAPINAMLICKLAQDNGIKVLLSGAGGDDIFTGYRRHYALLCEKYWSWMPHAMRAGIGSLSGTLPGSRPLGRRIAKAFQYSHLDGDERLISYFYWSDPADLLKLYTPEMKKELTGLPPCAPLLNSLSHIPQNVPPLNRMLYLEGKHFLADHNLNYTDKMSMCTGVEVRVPLLDPELVSLAARLPIKYKQRGRIGKWVFKRAMEPLLPHDVVYRPKTGFGAPLRYWLRHELRPMVNDLISESTLKKRGLFDFPAVKTMMDLDSAGGYDGSYTIFALMCIEMWCRIFLDQT